MKQVLARDGKTIKYDKLLKKLYYNIKYPSSFKGIYKLFYQAKKENPSILLDDVKTWLLKQDTYTLHHYKIKNFHRNPFVSRHIDDNWQIDLVDIEYPEENKRFKYMLVVIDVLSKYGWSVPLLNKKPFSIKKAFTQILRKSKRKPKVLTSDSGTEFNNSLFKRFLINQKIKHFIARNTEVKAAVVERWNRTIKEQLYKYMYFNKTKRFVNILNNIIDNYNSTIHSRTHFKPIDVNNENEDIVYKNLYNINETLKDPKYVIGDKVRIQRIKKTFEKGYKPNWSQEVFTITKVLNTSPTNSYIISDHTGEQLLGSFYPQELQIVNG